MLNSTVSSCANALVVPRPKVRATMAVVCEILFMRCAPTLSVRGSLSAHCDALGGKNPQVLAGSTLMSGGISGSLQSSEPAHRCGGKTEGGDGRCFRICGVRGIAKPHETFPEGTVDQDLVRVLIHLGISDHTDACALEACGKGDGQPGVQILWIAPCCLPRIALVERHSALGHRLRQAEGCNLRRPGGGRLTRGVCHMRFGMKSCRSDMIKPPDRYGGNDQVTVLFVTDRQDHRHEVRIL